MPKTSFYTVQPLPRRFYVTVRSNDVTLVSVGVFSHPTIWQRRSMISLEHREAIRRAYDVESKSIRDIAQAFRCSRDTVL